MIQRHNKVNIQEILFIYIGKNGKAQTVLSELVVITFTVKNQPNRVHTLPSQVFFISIFLHKQYFLIFHTNERQTPFSSKMNPPHLPAVTPSSLPSFVQMTSHLPPNGSSNRNASQNGQTTSYSLLSPLSCALPSAKLYQLFPFLSKTYSSWVYRKYTFHTTSPP